VALLDAARECACGQALASAVLTPPEHILPATRRRLGPLLDRWLAAH
jgi:hypothetical protein